MRSWQPGAQVLIRGIVHDRVWIVHPVTVVQDTDELLALYLTPGAPCKVPQGLIERKWGGIPNGSSRWDEQDGRQWEMADWKWQQRHALVLMSPEKYYAVYWFWSEETDEFEGWYVNFQLPFRKTDWSIDTLDLEIDLIIEPGGTWRWKDEAEYNAGVRRGSIPAGVAAQVAEARKEILGLISSGDSHLFDRKWLDWQPEPDWGVPPLHPDWHIVRPSS